MSLRAQMWVWEQDLPANAKLVMLAFADHAHDNGREARPGLDLVARKTGFSRRQVQRIVAECVRLGTLVVERESNRTNPTCYRIPVDTPVVVHRGEWSTSGATPELRLAVIEAFAQTCHHCKQTGGERNGPDGHPWEVDRLVSGRDGGTYARDNVVLSCRSCNRRKGAGAGRQDDAPSETGQNDAPRGDTAVAGGATDPAGRGDRAVALTVLNPPTNPPTTEQAPAAQEPRGVAAARWWWEHQTPRPAGKGAWHSLRRSCEAVGERGWAERAILDALVRIGSVPSVQQLDRELRNPRASRDRAERGDQVLQGWMAQAQQGELGLPAGDGAAEVLALTAGGQQ